MHNKITGLTLELKSRAALLYCKEEDTITMEFRGRMFRVYHPDCSAIPADANTGSVFSRCFFWKMMA